LVRHSFEHSTKPLLVAGHGIRIADAQEEFYQLLSLGLPVVTTFNGFDLVPNGHPSFAGRIGTVGTRGGYYALQHCDLLICVGTRNNTRQISYRPETFAPQAKKIIVDIDEAELLKPTVQGLKYHADAKAFLKELLEWDWRIDQKWTKDLHSHPGLVAYRLSLPYKFIHDLTVLLPEDAVVVCGNGTACVSMFQAGIVKNGQRIFWNSGCASMGYDLPAAIGACFANGKKEVICITGDGSIQMNIQELQTISHHNLPIKIFVLNNGGYRSIEMTQQNYFNSDFIGCNAASGVSFPDFAKIAFAYDIKYFHGTEAIREVLDYKGSALCEVEIGNDYIIEPKWTGGFHE